MSGLGRILEIRKCSVCEKEIQIRHLDRMERKDVFCSKKCEGEYRKASFNVTCDICGKTFHKKNSRIKKSSHNFCSRACKAIYNSESMSGKNNHQYGLLGNKNASWKSDKKVTNYGYIKIRSLNHPFRDIDGFVFEHRLIAEIYLLDDENSITIEGFKYLNPKLVVHHADKNKTNNDVSNLKIMSKSDHMSLHKRKK